jgi:hypothetical protein
LEFFGILSIFILLFYNITNIVPNNIYNCYFITKYSKEIIELINELFINFFIATKKNIVLFWNYKYNFLLYVLYFINNGTLIFYISIICYIFKFFLQIILRNWEHYLSFYLILFKFQVTKEAIGFF